MPSAIVVGAFFQPTESSRPNLVASVLAKRYDVKILTASFDHSTKQKRREIPPNVQVVRVAGYSRNRSLRRLLSHLQFSLGCVRYLARSHPSLVYICVPPNLAAFWAVRLCRRRHIKCVVDVVDVWPSPRAVAPQVLAPVLRAWAALRTSALEKADVVVLECELYREVLSGDTAGHVIPLAKRRQSDPGPPIDDLDNGTLRIAYIGAFGGNYDFDTLARLASSIRKWKILVEVIGGGERKAEVICMMREAGIEVVDHGYVYDEVAKSLILARCSLGYNGFTPQAFVGLSYKTVDYLSFGLGVINTNPGDTWDMIERDGAGVNHIVGSEDVTAARIDALTPSSIREMRVAANSTFVSRYSYERFAQELASCVEQVGGGDRARAID